MADKFFDYAAEFRVKESSALNTFSSALNKQIGSLEKRQFTRRSWVREDGEGYVIKLGKLDGSYRFANDQAAMEFLQRAKSAVHSDEELQAMIEEAYGEPVATEPKKRKSRKAKGE